MSGLETGEKFDTNNISKLISERDAMSKDHDGVTEQPGEEHEGGGGQRETKHFA